jgi:hypothetical protein
MSDLIYGLHNLLKMVGYINWPGVSMLLFL